MRKRRLDEHRADSASREFSRKAHLYLILDNIRSMHNVGAVFRAADGFGVRKIFLTGITARPPRPEIDKIALGAERTIEFEWMEDPAKAVILLREMGVPVVACEQTRSSVSVFDYPFTEPLGLIVGHEQVGVDDQLLSLVEAAVEIPMYGSKHSHNVATAAAIILSEVRRQWSRRELP